MILLQCDHTEGAGKISEGLAVLVADKDHEEVSLGASIGTGYNRAAPAVMKH